MKSLLVTTFALFSLVPLSTHAAGDVHVLLENPTGSLTVKKNIMRSGNTVVATFYINTTEDSLGYSMSQFDCSRRVVFAPSVEKYARPNGGGQGKTLYAAVAPVWEKVPSGDNVVNKVYSFVCNPDNAQVEVIDRGRGQAEIQVNPKSGTPSKPGKLGTTSRL